MKFHFSSGKTSAVSGKSTPASSGGSDKKPRKRHFLGQLSVDRQYLENLLQHPGKRERFFVAGMVISIVFCHRHQDGRRGIGAHHFCARA
jgi:hypothetical protein